MCQGIVVGDCHTRNKIPCSDQHFQEEHISKRKGGLSERIFISLGIHTEIETTEKGRDLFVSSLESMLDVAGKQQASVYVPQCHPPTEVFTGPCTGDTIFSLPHRQ